MRILSDLGNFWDISVIRVILSATRSQSSSSRSRITGKALIVCGSEPLAAFCTPSFEHQLPTFCAHAHAEAVRFGAPAIVRLKCPLHVLCSSKDVFTENTKPIEMAGTCQAFEDSLTCHVKLVGLLRMRANLAVQIPPWVVGGTRSLSGHVCRGGVWGSFLREEAI